MKKNTEIYSKDIGTPFNSEKDISKREKRKILSEIKFLNAKAKDFNTVTAWEEFFLNSKNAKLLFPKEKKLEFNTSTYNIIHALSERALQQNNLTRHLNIAVAEKILFPKEWSLRNKDFHSDELIWQKSLNILKNFSKEDKITKWIDIYPFIYFTQNLKILAPKRFETLDIQKILGTDIWHKHIEEELECTKQESYSHFLCFATPLQILEYPSKLEIEPHEWQEMEFEALKFKDEEILFFTGFSSQRNILAAKEINITNESFDLIF